MVILADTSVWVSHLRQLDVHLSALLDEAVIVVHPFVIGELACGSIKKRREILSLLQALPQTPVVSQSELLHFIESRGLAGAGIGFVDAHLLAAAELMRGYLWTTDKALRHAADKMDLAY